MTRSIRWNIQVTAETDLALRVHLAARGMRKGNMSRFIEEAVLLKLFGNDVQKIRSDDPDAELDLTGEDVTDKLAAVADRLRLRVYEAGLADAPLAARKPESPPRKKSEVARRLRQPAVKRSAGR